MRDTFGADYDDGVKQLDMPRTKKKEPVKKLKMEETKEFKEGQQAYLDGKVGDCCIYPSDGGNSAKRVAFWNGYYAQRIEKYLKPAAVEPEKVLECAGA